MNAFVGEGIEIHYTNDMFPFQTYHILNINVLIKILRKILRKAKVVEIN